MGFEVIQFKDKNIFAYSWLVWKHFRKFKIQTSCDSDIQNHQIKRLKQLRESIQAMKVLLGTDILFLHHNYVS